MKAHLVKTKFDPKAILELTDLGLLGDEYVTKISLNGIVTYSRTPALEGEATFDPQRRFVEDFATLMSLGIDEDTSFADGFA